MTVINMCSNFSGMWDSPTILKHDYLRKKLIITLKYLLFNEFEKVEILRKYFDLMETTFFGSNKGQILPKNVLLPKIATNS